MFFVKVTTVIFSSHNINSIKKKCSIGRYNSYMNALVGLMNSPIYDSIDSKDHLQISWSMIRIPR